MAKFKPRARIIRTIGDQLISGPEAAIIELVKNSYDAEASYSKVSFNYSEGEGFSIVVADDGHGMTYNDIIHNWLEPATDVKVKDRLSKTNRRRLLGAKGIGRFAVSKLGGISLLTSVGINEEQGYKESSSICVDWSLFSAEKYLEDIELDVSCSQVADCAATGVEIEITQLRDSWSKSQLERLILELRRLSHPQADDEFSVYLDLSCFTTSNARFDGAQIFSAQNDSLELPSEAGASEPNLIRPYIVGDVADYQLEGRFDEDGSFTGIFQNQRGDNVAQSIELPSLALSEDEAPCGSISIKLNLFDREAESVAKLFERMKLDFAKIGIRRARKILTEMSGISISRNGFRIRPYGDPDHDWLGLQAMRVQDPSKKLGSDQVSGYVEIADEQTSGIVERSSREGLELNDQYRRLRSLVLNLLPHIEERRFDFREKAGIGRRPATNVEKAREASKLKQVTKVLKKVPAEYREKLVVAIEKDAAAINTMLDEVDAYQKILQSRSALGLVVAEVIHEGRRRLDPMLTSIKTLKADFKHAFERNKIGELYRQNFPAEIETLLKGGTALGRLFKRLDPISGRRRGRPVNFLPSDVFSDTLEIMRHAIENSSIEVEHEVPREIKCYGYLEDLQAALLNVLENATYWLSTSSDSDRRIKVSVHVTRKKVRIAIANNGPGIDGAYIARLFDAGFSLKSDGTGLGLAIAREACRASKGDLVFDDLADETTFVVEFPRGS